jgi:hypothetical protein
MPVKPRLFRPPTSPLQRSGPRHTIGSVAVSVEHGYTRRWEKARLAFLAEHPLCVMCEQEGTTTAATDVDHRMPHRGDPVLGSGQLATALRSRATAGRRARKAAGSLGGRGDQISGPSGGGDRRANSYAKSRN